MWPTSRVLHGAARLDLRSTSTAAPHSVDARHASMDKRSLILLEATARKRFENGPAGHTWACGHHGSNILPTDVD